MQNGRTKLLQSTVGKQSSGCFDKLKVQHLKFCVAFQVKFYPEGIVKKIKFNSKIYPLEVFQNGKTVRLGNLVKLGVMYSFYPHMDSDNEENLFHIQFMCDEGILGLTRYSQIVTQQISINGSWIHIWVLLIKSVIKLLLKETQQQGTKVIESS